MVPRRCLLLLQSGLIASAFTIGGKQPLQQNISGSLTSTSRLFATTSAAPTSSTMNSIPVDVIDDLLLGSTTEHRDNYDIVKVDLDDGRDYPIYLGTGYSDTEGASSRRYSLVFFFIDVSTNKKPAMHQPSFIYLQPPKSCNRMYTAKKY